MTDHNLNLDALRKIAENATPGPWENWEGEVGDPQGGFYVAQITSNDDGAFISTFDPPTVLALIDMVEGLREALASSEYMRDVQRKDRTAQALDRLRAENDRLRGEVERLRASLNEARQRLSNTDWSRQAEDRNRGALLHIESALNGTARPLAFVESERDEARAALKHDREVAAKAWDEGNSHGYKDAQGYHAHGDGCGPDFWDCDCENPYGGDSDERLDADQIRNAT